VAGLSARLAAQLAAQLASVGAASAAKGASARATILALALCITSITAQAQTPPRRHNEEHPRRILFIGNSLTYVNNLPSAFASLAPADMHLSVDMIARAGAAREP
jgi:hypothetical protein